MEKGILAQLLEALEKTRPLSRHPILAELVSASREPVEGQWKYPFHLVRHVAIEIIKSGIFVGDRLKGREIASIPPKLKTYPINDPEGVVFFIAMPLVRDVANDISQGMRNSAQTAINHCFSGIVAHLNRLSELPDTWGIDLRERNLKELDFYHEEIKLYFSEILLNMNPLPGVIKIWGSHRIKEKIEKIKSALDSLKEELLINVPEDYFTMEDLIDYMVSILQKHVPEAPEETVAKRVVNILKISNIADARYQTVLQRMYRKKQKRT